MTHRWLLVACLFLLASLVFAEGPVVEHAPPATGPGVGVGTLGPAVPAERQAPDSIDFGGHRISLGMPQSEVLRLVGENFRVEDKGDGLWWVNDNSAGGTIGKLYFNLKRLVAVIRDWEVGEPVAGPAVNTLSTAFAAISQLVPGTLRACKVYPDRLPTQTGFSLSCGPMMVQVFMVEEEDGTQRAFVHTALGSLK